MQENFTAEDQSNSNNIGGASPGDAGLVVGGVDMEDAMFVAKRKMQIFLDRISFYPGRRWLAFSVALAFFLTRMYI